MDKRYMISYKHNNITPNGAKWIHGCAIDQKRFSSEAEALEWVENNKQYTPIKLLIWNDAIDGYDTLKDFRIA